MSRDYQKQKVYNAENSTFEMFDPEFDTMVECQKYADLIMSSSYWIKQKGWKKIILHNGAGNTCATYCKRVRGRERRIKLPKWARSRIVMIHEFAHALTDRTYNEASSHGTYFCKHYLELINVMLGSDSRNKLQLAFDTFGVKYLK